MTKKQKLSFYKELLKVVCENLNTRRGFCWYINNMDHWYTENKVPCIDAYDKKEFNKHLPELYAYKLNNKGYWFPENARGWQKRIDILVEIIEKLK